MLTNILLMMTCGAGLWQKSTCGSLVLDLNYLRIGRKNNEADHYPIFLFHLIKAGRRHHISSKPFPRLSAFLLVFPFRLRGVRGQHSFDRLHCSMLERTLVHSAQEAPLFFLPVHFFTLLVVAPCLVQPAQIPVVFRCCQVVFTKLLFGELQPFELQHL